jgi:hypothetical protein
VTNVDVAASLGLVAPAEGAPEGPGHKHARQRRRRLEDAEYRCLAASLWLLYAFASMCIGSL